MIFCFLNIISLFPSQDLTSRKPKLKHANTQTDTVYPNKDVTPKKIFKSKCPTTSVSPRPATTSYKKQHDDDYPLFPDVSGI